MSVMKEWECKAHGVFECTHPICPEIGCESKKVTRVFLTPPNIGTEMAKRFHESTKKTVDMMKLGNLRSAREGETSWGNNGSGMLWGDQVQKVLGVDMATLVGNASKPLEVTRRDGTREKVEKSVMRELAGEGMTGRRLPKPAELTGHTTDKVKPQI